MKTPPLIPVCIVALSGFITSSLRAEVEIKERDDCLRVEIDGELFTEWQHQAWKAPYLYPVIGPNGENMTRHFPMKDGVESESQDHPHHRSIRFSHRDVNGYSFWAPDSKPNGTQAEVRLDKIAKCESGESGELVLHNTWLGDGKPLLKEKLRLRFLPLPNREVLMDYDTELTAVSEDVTFRDQKDGGLGVRVAGTMKVTDRKTKTGKGTILNSKGDKNGEAWGKRAEWADYFGPDASGKIVGIAMFDHPSNLRYPTHWHARTYGLITANRFGTGAFEAKQGAKKGDGDYTIKKGETLKLRHRIFIHHGDPKSAQVAKHYADYIAKEK